ncbi:MAG: exonuclease domain-containing protein [Hyphomicrobiales bacterium]
MDYVAIDVETANGDIASICQIGIATYANGKLVSEWSSLINPKEDFNYFNIRIHGIQQADVKNAPTFEQVYKEIFALLSDKFVVSHTFFDKTAIEKSCQKFNLPSIDNKWLDSCKIARKAWGHIPLASYGLANVCQFIGFKFNHHDALEDAKACGAIMSAALIDTETTPQYWFNLPVKVKKSKTPKSKQNQNPIPNPHGALVGHTIAFTGKLSITRAQALKLAANSGCIFSKSVQWHTNYLIVGAATKSTIGKSTKHIQAENFNQSGHSIRILNEAEFQVLVCST